MTAGSIAVPSIVPLRIPNGKLKNVIDTNTPIELKTETPNAEIYFTIDGSKPDPFAALGVDRSTIKYTKPFKLREGKKTVKAVALSRDGTRESHIVTKCFEIEKDYTEDFDQENTLKSTKSKMGDSNNYGFIDELERERKKELIKKRSILKKIVDTNTNISYRSEGGGSDNESARYGKETKFLGKRFNKTLNFTVDYNPNLNKSQTHLSNEELNRSSTNNSRFIMPDSSAQALKLQRETDFLKCVACFARRPNDPQARYCVECGANLPQIPQTKLIPPQSGQLGTCFYCKSLVPFNTSICVICENPIIPQLEPQASIKLQGKIHCSNCMTSNPANYKTCVVCDAKIDQGAKVHPVDLSMVVPQYPVASGKSSTCSQCFRVNRNDSRFCDWCGAKPLKQLGPLACMRCGANNNPYSKFCISCGSLIQPPTNQNPNTLTLASSSTTQPTWLTHIDSKAMQILNKQYNTTSTQTYGLFYTSAKGLENKNEREEKSLKQEQESRDRKLNLTAISAGKGYWRQQMDHICAHLKAYAQNNSEFRAGVAEPRLGKISTAKVDIDPSWCTITCTFPIRNLTTKDSFNSSAIVDRALSSTGKLSHFNHADYEQMSNVVAGHESSLSEDTISETEDSFRSVEKVRKHKKKVHQTMEDKLTGEDRQLIKELSKQGRGRPKEVRNLLNEGANAKIVTKDGLNMIHLAVKNKHFDCVPILVDSNADLNAKMPSKMKGNTALHEAVLLGHEGDGLIKMLLDLGANPNVKNSKNETPFELAIKENNTSAINLLGSQVGSDMLKSYLRTKSSSDIKP